MDEYKKWLENKAEHAMIGSMWDALDKYRSMTCKMEYIDGLYSCFKCSECGELCNEDCAEHPRYCPNCGRRVVEEKE